MTQKIINILSLIIGFSVLFAMVSYIRPTWLADGGMFSISSIPEVISIIILFASTLLIFILLWIEKKSKIVDYIIKMHKKYGGKFLKEIVIIFPMTLISLLLIEKGINTSLDVLVAILVVSCCYVIYTMVHEIY